MDFNQRVKCKNCGKEYLQQKTEKPIGGQSLEYDICPYCGKENDHSMNVEYINYKIDQ